MLIKLMDELMVDMVLDVAKNGMVVMNALRMDNELLLVDMDYFIMLIRQPKLAILLCHFCNL